MSKLYAMTDIGYYLKLDPYKTEFSLKNCFP
jgi:hypothetical protein